MSEDNIHKNHRGNASQFFVAGELCRRGMVAVVTLGNSPNTDILCSNSQGTKFVHIQVKTYVPKPKGTTCIVGKKAEKNYGANFVWVLGGIPNPNTDTQMEFYVIPSSEMSKNVKHAHELWLQDPKPNGEQRQDTVVRTIHIPPKKDYAGWSIEQFKNRWDIIEDLLNNKKNLTNHRLGVCRS